MNVIILSTLLALFSFSERSNAFILISENFRIANHKAVIVNVGTGACRSDGISDADLMASITDAVQNFWNTVTESELRLNVGAEVPRTGFGNAEAGEILIFCAEPGRLSSAGATTINERNGSATIGLNAASFTSGDVGDGYLTQVIAHEMGHALNLAHSGDPASVMTYETHEWYGRPKYLSQDDKDGIAFLYPRELKGSGLIPGCSAVAGTALGSEAGNGSSTSAGAQKHQSSQQPLLSFIGFVVELFCLWILFTFFRRSSQWLNSRDCLGSLSIPLDLKSLGPIRPRSPASTLKTLKKSNSQSSSD